MSQNKSIYSSVIFITPLLIFVILVISYLLILKELSSAALISLMLLCFVGIQNLLMGVGNLFRAKSTSQIFGWVSNQFQSEYSYVNFALAVLGILSFWNQGNFWIATSVVYIPLSFFIIPPMVGELKRGSTRNYLLGYFAVQNLIIPVSLIVLLFSNCKNG